MIDTHVAVALYQGKTAGLSKAALRAIDNEPISLSPAVALEIELLHEIGRLRLGAGPVIAYLSKEVSIPLAGDRFADVVLHALALSFARDPFDRLITAHADLQQATLITLDESIHQNYARALS